MKYKGYGAIYNPNTRKIIVSFNLVSEYETEDTEEMKILEASGYITSIEGVLELDEKKEIDHNMTKKEIIEILDDTGIEYNLKDRKEILLSLLDN